MMAKDGASGVTEPAAGLSQVERVVDTLISPSKTFTDILRSTTWWAPFLLLAVLSMASALVIDKQVGFDTVVQNTLHDTPKVEERLAEQEPQQRAAQIHAMSNSYRYASYASPLLVLLFSALGALGLWGTFNFALGAKTTFGQMFAVWMYASLPRVIGSVLVMVTLFVGGGAESFSINNPIGTNLAFYLPDAAPWFKTLLSFFDVFGLWVVALLIFGTGIVAGVKRSHAAAVVGGWWLLILILSVAGAVLRS